MKILKMFGLIFFLSLSHFSLYGSAAAQQPLISKGKKNDSDEIDKKAGKDKKVNGKEKTVNGVQYHSLDSDESENDKATFEGEPKFDSQATKALSKLFKSMPVKEQEVLRLLKAKADPNVKVGEEFILAKALEKGQKNVVLLLLNFGAKPDECSEDAVSAISYIKTPDDASLLLMNDKFLGQDRFGNNPIHHLVTSARSGWGNFDKAAPHVQTLDYYLKRGVDKNAVDKAGLTPLLAAINDGHLDMVIALCRNQVDRDPLMLDGRSAVELANELANAEPEGEKQDRYLLISGYLYWEPYFKDMFANKNYAQTQNLITFLGRRVKQNPEEAFGQVWLDAKTQQEKEAAMRTLIKFMGEFKKEYNDIPATIEAAEMFLKDVENQLPAPLVKELSNAIQGFKN